MNSGEVPYTTNYNVMRMGNLAINMIASKKFQHKTDHKITLLHPDTGNHVLINKKGQKIIQDRLFCGADVETEHLLIIVTVRVKLVQKSTK